MFQSNGVLVKSQVTLWEGSPANWPANLPIGNVWSSYAELYRKQLWVNVLVDKRAKACARLPFKVYQRGTEGREDGSSSAFGQLMARPSKSIDPFLFWMWTQSTKDIHGEAFWLKIRDRLDRPVELLPIHPTKVHDEVVDGRVKWEIRIGSTTISVNRRDLVHFREFNPDTLLRGMSKLEPLRATLENEDGARRANSAMWRHGGKPSVALEHPGELSDTAIKRLAAQWSDIHGGVDNWGKALVLEEGMKATMYQLNVEELQYIEARKLNREEVCAAYDTPPPVVHILDRATFSNITEQMRSMYRDTMGTVLGSLESTVETELRDGTYGTGGEPDFGSAFYGEFLLDEVLRGDFEARQSAYALATYMTLAEKRAKENLPFIEGTQFIFLNSASLPLGADGLLVQPAAATDGEGPTATTAADIALMLQKIYLAVGVVITAEEARALLNSIGAGLTGPAPQKSNIIEATYDTVEQNSLRSVMGRLSRIKSLTDVDAEALVAGIDADAVAVLKQLVGAQLDGDSIDGLKGRLRALSAGRDH